jgi:hypothetical protein
MHLLEFRCEGNSHQGPRGERARRAQPFERGARRTVNNQDASLVSVNVSQQGRIGGPNTQEVVIANLHSLFQSLNFEM